MTVRAPSIIVCALAAVAAGCASPPSHFFTLSAVATPATSSTHLSVTVGPISVPAVVDRPEFVVSAVGNELRLDEFSRWASPLKDNLSCVVAENLVAILGTPRVTVFPQTLTTDVDYRVSVEVLRFESTPGDSAVLDAVWTVSRAGDGMSETGRTTQREIVLNDSFDALAAAHSRAVARMCDAIADAVRALEPPASKPSKPVGMPRAKLSVRYRVAEQ